MDSRSVDEATLCFGEAMVVIAGLAFVEGLNICRTIFQIVTCEESEWRINRWGALVMLLRYSNQVSRAI